MRNDANMIYGLAPADLRSPDRPLCDWLITIFSTATVPQLNDDQWIEIP